MKQFFFTISICVMNVFANAQKVFPLYNGTVPNNKPCAKQEVSPAEGRVQGILQPTLTAYFPAVKDSLKTVVIVCPGGGYARLAIQHEGYQVAEALNKKGITAFVLKYRNPIDAECFENREIVAFQDAQQAIKMVRDRAIEWDINPEKVGIMGFSAGGHLASTAATHFKTTVIQNIENTNLKPDFAILAYPVISFSDSLAHKGSRDNMLGKNASIEKINLYSNELQITPETPPTFLMHAADDKSVVVQNSLVFYSALLKNKVPAEIHLFQKGGHGFGLNNKLEQVDWLQNVFAWLKTNSFAKANAY